MHFVMSGLIPEISVSLSEAFEFPTLGAINSVLLFLGSVQG